MHNKLRQLRRSRNMTLAQVAEQLGTTAQTVSRLETQVITLSADWLEKFGALFGVDPGQILGSRNDPPAELIGRLDRFGKVTDPGTEPFDIALPAGPTTAVTLSADIGPYRSGDVLLTSRLYGADIANAVGHDALVALNEGPVLLRRLLNGQNGHYVLVPLESGETVQYGAALDWAGRVQMRISYL